MYTLMQSLARICNDSCLHCSQECQHMVCANDREHRRTRRYRDNFVLFRSFFYLSFLSFFLSFLFFFFLYPPEFGGLLREQLSEKFRGNVAKSRKRRNSRDYRFSVLKSVLLCLETVLLAFNGETRVKRGTFLFLSFAFALALELRVGWFLFGNDFAAIRLQKYFVDYGHA